MIVTSPQSDPGQTKVAAKLAEAGMGRRERMRRRWRRRAQRLIFDITQFGRDDANSGSWDADEMTIFEAQKPVVRKLLLDRLTKLAEEYVHD